MELDILIKHFPDVSISIKGKEWQEFADYTASKAIEKFLQKHDEKVFNRKEVVEKFGICETTLWRWDKMGLIESKKIGNRVFYPESEIKRLMSQKGVEK